MTSIIRWRPDTCECVFTQIYDGSTFIEQGTVERKCEFHQGIADADIDATIKKEMKQKATALRVLIGLEGGLDLGLKHEKEGNFKEGVDWTWHYEGNDADRVFKFEVTGAQLTPEQYQEVTQVANAALSEGTVDAI